MAQVQHPCVRLKRHLPKDTSSRKLAGHIGTSASTAHRVMNGLCVITPEMAVRLGHLTGTKPEVWLKQQMLYDLAEVDREAVQSEVTPL